MQVRNDDEGTWVDIFWNDLCPETQNELFDLMGENGNFDVFPIASVNITKEE